MKILITGGNGQVAFELMRLATQKNYSLYAPDHSQLDISQAQAVRDVMNAFHPDVVINTAAYTRVDQAEQEKEKARAVNCEGAQYLAIACAELDCPLLHLSTDYVFDGKQGRPYDEDDLVSPINAYGASKWAGEQMIRQHCDKYIILRVSAVFGIHGNNFVKTILRLAHHQPVLRIVNDQSTCPTPAAAIAEVLLQLMQVSEYGTYHYCGDEVVTWYDFAKRALAIANQTSAQVEAVTTAEYPTAAKRPMYSVLNCHRLEKTFSIQKPHWEKGLQYVIKHLSTS